MEESSRQEVCCSLMGSNCLDGENISCLTTWQNRLKELQTRISGEGDRIRNTQIKPRDGMSSSEGGKANGSRYF